MQYSFVSSRIRRYKCPRMLALIALLIKFFNQKFVMQFFNTDALSLIHLISHTLRLVSGQTLTFNSAYKKMNEYL